MIVIDLDKCFTFLHSVKHNVEPYYYVEYVPDPSWKYVCKCGKTHDNSEGLPLNQIPTIMQHSEVITKYDFDWGEEYQYTRVDFRCKECYTIVKSPTLLPKNKVMWVNNGRDVVLSFPIYDGMPKLSVGDKVTVSSTRASIPFSDKFVVNEISLTDVELKEFNEDF